MQKWKAWNGNKKYKLRNVGAQEIWVKIDFQMASGAKMASKHGYALNFSALEKRKYM